VSPADRFPGLRTKVASGTVDITPIRPVPMAGYYTRVKAYEGIHDPLEANAMLVVGGERRLFFLSLDALYFGPVVTSFVEETLVAHGISSEDVFLTASHTHFAPATDPQIAQLGQPDEGYLNHLKARIGGLVEQVLSSTPIDVDLEHRKVHLPFCVNRRALWRLPRITRRGLAINTIVNAPNPRGSRDETGDLIVARTGVGTPLAVIWRYACHPVCFPHRRSISAEYPGVVRTVVRRECGRDVPVLFWQGFAGDIRPTLGATPSLRDIPRTVFRGPRFTSVSASAWHGWAGGIADRIATAVRSREGSRVLDGSLTTASYSLPVSEFISGASTSRTFRIQRLSFGSSLTVIFASAEIVADHVDGLSILGDNVIGVGCVGDVFGYFPTDKQVNEGGYEAADWLGLFRIGAGFKRSPDALWAEILAIVAAK
jgi:hypothetical protein